MTCLALRHNRPLARTTARPANPSARSTPTVANWTILSAGLSPALLAGAWLLGGALQPAPYSPVRQTVSVLAGHAGTNRWIVTGALFLVGGCHLATAAGLRGVRASARLLLIVAGVAGIGIAASPEPVHGSTPQHLAWTALGAVTLAIWPAFLTRRTSPQPLILSVHGSAIVTAVFLALLGWVAIETQGGDTLGLAERLAVTVQTSWPFIVAVALRRITAQPSRQQPSAEHSTRMLAWPNSIRRAPRRNPPPSAIAHSATNSSMTRVSSVEFAMRSICRPGTRTSARCGRGSR